MKIILGHDYYDGAQSLGTDESVKFIRSAEIMDRNEFSQIALNKAIQQTPLKELIENNSLYSFECGIQIKTAKYWQRNSLWTELILVGVAGKVYLGFAISSEEKDIAQLAQGYTHIPNPTYCWSEQQLNEFGERHKIQIAPMRTANTLQISDFYKYNGTEFAPVRDCMIEHKISVFTLGATCSGYQPQEKWQSIYCVINGDNLKYAQFHKCLDTYSIYQELAMWNGGILAAPETPMVTISEKIKVKQHGFDKWSFRKMGEHSK